MQSKPNIILSGFMATGKSSVGRRLAVLLGYDFLDVDTLIAAEAGMPISEIFASQGEPAFRAMETRMAERVSGRQGCVVATGGGTIVNPRNLEALKRSGPVITLTASPETILSRIGSGEDRPMLWGGDKLEKIRNLLQQRAQAYANADLIVDASGKTIDQVVNHIMDFLALHQVAAKPAAIPTTAQGLRLVLGNRSQSYQVVIGPGVLDETGQLLQGLSLASTGVLVASPHDNQLFGNRLTESLSRSGISVAVIEVPDQEEQKGLETLEALYRRMALQHLERHSPVFTLGGVATGELGGFAAATYLRGLPLIQIPTSLIAQVDTSIGGKVGVNLPEGKNLVGAFYQPLLVVTDVEILASLNEREFRSGLAEVVKVAAIRDPEFFEYLESSVEEVLSRDLRVLVRLVRRACEIKASVVEADERESSDVRMLLNFGHTVGHALEAATGYRGPDHGESVAVGMVVATTLAAQKGICKGDDLERLKKLLQAYGLPTRLPVRPDEVTEFIRYDKKIQGGQIRLITPRSIGDATVTPIEDPQDLEKALAACG